MALSNALPDPREWFRQWSFEPGERFTEDLASKAITAGSIAMTIIVLGSLAMLVGLGTTLAEGILGFTIDLGFLGLGEATVFPALALVGGVGAVIYTLQIESIAGDREVLRDDANWIILVSAGTYILAALQVSVPFAATTSFAFILLGTSLAVLYVWRVVAA